MPVEGKLLKTDQLGRSFAALKQADVDIIYEEASDWWKTRGGTPEEDAKIVNGNILNITPFNEGEQKKLREIERELRGPLSIVEVGAANGTIFDRLGTERVVYTGFECNPILVDDFKSKYPGRSIRRGDVEDFLGYPLVRCVGSLFYSHVCLLMVKPDLVRKVLKKASELCDEFLIYDYLAGIPEDIELPEGETLVIKADNHPDIWFVHDWKKYIKDVGFKIIDWDIPNPPMSDDHDHTILGCGYFHAVRG